MTVLKFAETFEESAHILIQAERQRDERKMRREDTLRQEITDETMNLQCSVLHSLFRKVKADVFDSL